MSDKVKKIMQFQLHHYKNIEMKLEKMAAKGLVLEKCGAYLWTFSKCEPKKLKYTVTYFSEGSLFNPDITENQQTYFEYAKAAGWEFVTGLNQMQIFSSEAEDPVPFETDEKEKFENIKKCMRKSFLPSIIGLILVFLFNLIVQFNSFQVNPIDFLSDTNRLLPVMMIFSVILYYMYMLVDYWIWCKSSNKCIAMGGGCIEHTKRTRKIVDMGFVCYILFILIWFVFAIVAQGNWFAMIIGMTQIPICILVFWTSIKYLKKKKVSAIRNKIISIAILIAVAVVYLAVIFMLIIRFDFHHANEADYRIVQWEVSPKDIQEYEIYSDDIPLTCEDLYGPLAYDYYSYEERVNSTIFMTQSSCSQYSLPAKDAPPQLEYQILEISFDFVYQIVKGHLLEIPEWHKVSSMKSMDNHIFSTIEAYQEYYNEAATGNYILCFEDKIITLNMEEEATLEQIEAIKEKLQL